MSIKKFVLAFAFAASSISAHAKISSNNVLWNVRTTGSDTNGGCFDNSVTSPGTDYSQQASAQITYTDLVLVTTTTMTSSANPFNSADVGNCINITGGTGFTAGWYEVVSVTGGTATMNQVVGTASSTGGTGYLGGALLTIGTAAAQAYVGNGIWVRTGTYSQTAQITFGESQVYVAGYGTTYGDNGAAPLITTATNSTILFSTTGASALLFYNLSFSNTAATRDEAFYASTNGGLLSLVNCSFSGFTDAVLTNSSFSTNLSLSNVSVTGSTSYAIDVTHGGSLVVMDSVFTGGSATAIIFTTPTTSAAPVVEVMRSVFASNAGYGFMTGGSAAIQSPVFVADTWYANTSGGLYLNSTGLGASFSLINNIFYGNGGYAVTANSWIPYPASANTYANQTNAYGNNTSGNRNGFAAGIGDVTLTANPFVNASGGNFALNTTAGGGAALRGAGFPGVLGSSTGYLDIGAIQSQTTSGGTANYGFAN